MRCKYFPSLLENASRLLLPFFLGYRSRLLRLLLLASANEESDFMDRANKKLVDKKKPNKRSC